MELFNRPTMQQRVPVFKPRGTRTDAELSGPEITLPGRGIPMQFPTPVSVEKREPPVLSERVISTQIAPPVLAGLADFFTALNSPQIAGQQGQGRILQAQQDLGQQRALAGQESQMVLTAEEMQQAAEERAEQRRLQGRREALEDRRVTVQEEGLLQRERIETMRHDLAVLREQARDERQQKALDAAEKRFQAGLAASDARQLRGFEHQLKLMKERQTVGPAQRTAVAEMRALRDVDFANVERTFEQAKDIIGPVASRGRTLATSAGLEVDPRFLNLKAAVAGLRNKLLKVRSGAAVTDQELRRISTEELPNENDTAQNFAIKLETALTSLRQTITIFEEVHGIESNVGAPTSTDTGGVKILSRRPAP